MLVSELFFTRINTAAKRVENFFRIYNLLLGRLYDVTYVTDFDRRAPVMHAVLALVKLLRKRMTLHRICQKRRKGLSVINNNLTKLAHILHAIDFSI